MSRVARRTVATVVIAAGVAVSAGVAAVLAVEQRLDRVYTVGPIDVASLRISGSADAIERGRHLVRGVAQCTTCHGPDLAGQPMADDLLIGRLHAPNLTPGEGGIGKHSTRDLVKSIRHGVGRDGHPLVVMPSQYLYQLSDSDLGAVISYLRSLPPIDRPTPELRLGPLSVVALLSGNVPELLPAEMLAEPPPRMRSSTPEPTADYGQYLIEISGCKVCHHDDLSGGLHPLSLPGEPPPPDLRPHGPLRAWSEQDFIAALRSGVTPDGRTLDNQWMPWKTFAQMSDLELRAIWRGLRSPSQRMDVSERVAVRATPAPTRARVLRPSSHPSD